MAPTPDDSRAPARAATRGRSVFLIGLMASGKTTIGLALAGTLDVPFVDNDTTIAVLAGVTTVELARRGGDQLHEWESRYAHALVARPERMVAGVAASTADRPGDLAALRAGGLLVYLRASPEVLSARIAAGPPRPWITGDPGELVRTLYAARDPLLSTACPVVVDAEQPVATCVELITRALRADAAR